MAMILEQRRRNQSFVSSHLHRRRLVTRAATETDNEFDNDDDDDQSSQLTLQDIQMQAKALREEAQKMENDLTQAKRDKEQKELAAVDRWIEELLVRTRVNDSTQLLHSVDEVANILKEKRYSHEHVNLIFDRLCETCPIRGRDSLDRTPLLALLVEASAQLDLLERKDNPNKRWNGRVERDLQKKLFAKEWGINLEDTKNSDGYSLDEMLGRF